MFANLSIIDLIKIYTLGALQLNFYMIKLISEKIQ